MPNKSLHVQMNNPYLKQQLLFHLRLGFVCLKKTDGFRVKTEKTLARIGSNACTNKNT